MSNVDSLVRGIRDGEPASLARAITWLEDRTNGVRDLASRLHAESGNADVIGVTGSPGAGKSTLVNRLIGEYRDRGLTVGVIAIDPASPFSGGSILGDRVRMDRAIGDSGVFVRSMSTRGALGGVSPATGDVIAAIDAWGADRIIVETVGAGQSEIEIVRYADTVAIVLQPASGDDIQMLKAGILEIGDVFVINKADLSGIDRTVQELRNMLQLGDGSVRPDAEWTPPIVETVATTGDGVSEFLDYLDAHATRLDETDGRFRRRRTRHAAELERILREEFITLLEAHLDDGIDVYADRIAHGQTDPYDAAEELLARLRAQLRDPPDR